MHHSSARPAAGPFAPRAVPGRHSVCMLGTVTALAVVACSDHATAPARVGALCGDGSIVQLDVLQARTVDCTGGGTSLALAGSGASYLVVPQFATGGVPNRAVSYAIGAPAGAASAARTTVAADLRRAGALAPWPQRARPGTRQAAFDDVLRAQTSAAVSSGAWRFLRPARPAQRPAVSFSSAPPAVGSIRDFQVLSTLDAQHPAWAKVSARLAYAGQNILIYIDTLAAATGFAPSQLDAFGRLFDQVLYPLDVNAFGPPSDIDQSGGLVMLLSPVVNALTPRTECDKQGFVAGFFFGYDLTSAANANHGELFYALAPDPAGTSSCAHSVAEVERTTPATFLHELQHLINFSQHVVARGGQSEEGWLDEGLSLVAEELGSLYYEAKYPPPAGRTNPNQLFPDSSQDYITGLLFDSYDYLLGTDTTTLTLHSDDQLGLEWRGGDWLFARWLGDQKGAGFYTQLEQSTLTGTANIAAAAGEPFASLFGDFSLALYTDSIPGQPKSSIPPRDRFAVRTLRGLYQALYNAVGSRGGVPRPFPIATTTLQPGATRAASMVPGTMSFYRLDTPAAAATVRLQFSAPGGAALAASLHPQVSIFRLPGP